MATNLEQLCLDIEWFEVIWSKRPRMTKHFEMLNNAIYNLSHLRIHYKDELAGAYSIRAYEATKDIERYLNLPADCSNIERESIAPRTRIIALRHLHTPTECPDLEEEATVRKTRAIALLTSFRKLFKAPNDSLNLS